MKKIEQTILSSVPSLMASATIAATILSAFGVLPATGQTLNEDLKLLASDGAAFDSFGWSIAIDNGVVAVGAYNDDDNGSDSGSAYLIDATTGTLIAKLLPSDGAAGDEFGYSIAIANGVVAVGAWYDEDNGSRSGSAYLFDASTGAQISKLLPNDGATRDEFGHSIAIANGVVAVGARQNDDNGSNSGSAYLFDVVTGAQIAKLLPSNGEGGDEFGWSIAIANGVVAVGAKYDDDNGISSGSAYVFDADPLSPDFGVQIAQLLPSDGAESAQFGSSIAIDNGVVAVGADRAGDYGSNSGSAYVFDAATGTQLFKLLRTSDGAANDFFGRFIAIVDGIVAVGAFFDDDNGSNSGSAYLYDASTGGQIAKLLPSDGASNERFGWSIAIDNGVVAVGAIADDANGVSSGSAYVFDTGTGVTCPADLTGDGLLNFFDVSAFLGAFAASDPIADFNGDGAFNFFDVSAFLGAFSAGCP